MIRKLATVVVAAVLVGACSSVRSPGSSARQTDREAQIRSLKARIVELQQQATMAEVELARMRRGVEELEQVLADSSDGGEETSAERGGTGSAEKSGAGRSAVPSDPSIEVADLDTDATPEVRPADPAPGEAESSVLSGDLDELGSGAAGGVGRDELPGDSASRGGPVPSEGQALYDRGYTLFHQGLYLDSESAFQQFLQIYGSTDLGDNALFWIGEGRFVRSDLNGALAAFRETIEQYPLGNKVPDAMLKVGDCLRDLGDLQGARDGYAEVVRRFPSSAAAAVAEDRLRQLP
jgi:tol-pal system protein YbgF